MAEAYIKLYKKMLKWEWYDDPNTKILFLHCLLRAEWKAGSWHGVPYEAGQFITSIQNLSKETHLSTQEVRTALKHLIATGELTTFQHGKARIITVVNWGEYQGGNKDSNNEVTGCQQDANKMLTPCKEYKNIRIKDNTNTNAREGIILGIYHNVRLTQDELQELMKQYPDDYKDMIDNLSTYMRSKGKLYDDHFATMMRWKHEDQEKAKQKPETKRRNLIEEIRNA